MIKTFVINIKAGPSFNAEFNISLGDIFKLSKSVSRVYDYIMYDIYNGPRKKLTILIKLQKREEYFFETKL